jgi:hypothetical protein
MTDDPAVTRDHETGSRCRPPAPAHPDARARPRTRRRWTTAAAAALLVAVACSSSGNQDPGPADGADTAPAGEADPSTPEAVDLQIVDLPDTVTAARFPVYSADSERILFSGIPAGSARVEVMSVAEDGTDLRCLSCAAVRDGDAALLKALPFPDGERIAVRVGEQSPVQPADHAVIECTPSVADCRSASLVPLAPPAVGDDAVVQDQRELRIAPDGRTVGLSQVRRRPDGDNALVAVVGSLRRTDDARAYEITEARVVSSLGELKNFTPDGRAVLVAAFTTLPDRAANPDIVRIDLATGDQENVTVVGDYDEDISLSPDQDWYVVASGRGSGLFETVSQVRRPNFLGPGLEPLTAYLFTHHRRELLEPWLVRAGAEQNGQQGQRLNPDSAHDGYDARTLVTWHPSGDRILFWEAQGDPAARPTGDTRIVVARLTDRRAVPPVPASPSPSPEPRWAPPLAGYIPPPFPAQHSRAGEASGTATVTEGPGPAPGQRTIEVRYDQFSDDGEWIIDGTESATYDDGLLGGTTYTADLTLSGDHHGFLRADATISAATLDGTIDSEVDGRTLHLP